MQCAFRDPACSRWVPAWPALSGSIREDTLPIAWLLTCCKDGEFIPVVMVHAQPNVISIHCGVWATPDACLLLQRQDLHELGPLARLPAPQVLERGRPAARDGTGRIVRRRVLRPCSNPTIMASGTEEAVSAYWHTGWTSPHVKRATCSAAFLMHAALLPHLLQGPAGGRQKPL